MGKLFCTILLTLLLHYHTPANAQSSASSSPLEEERLLNAQIQNQEAQAAYYQEQAKKLNEKPARKSLWANLADNPAPLISALVAIIAAMIAFISFLFNYRAAVQNQLDTQFYEALKRFGDKDSPALRVSAVGIIENMAHKERFSLRKHSLPGDFHVITEHVVQGPRKARFRYISRPYLSTAISQLLTGIYLEEYLIVQSSLLIAIGNLISVYPERVAFEASMLSISLKRAFCDALIEYLVAIGATKVPDDGDDLWKQTSIQTELQTEILIALKDEDQSSFSGKFEAALSREAMKRNNESRVQELDSSKEPIDMKETINTRLRALDNLRTTARRIQRNEAFLRTAIQGIEQGRKDNYKGYLLQYLIRKEPTEANNLAG